jgi:Na+/H+ antiporter NhaD/arsenite permease-like protein
MSGNVIIWVIAALAIAGMILRPGGLPEVVWALGGALLLVILGRITPFTALRREGIEITAWRFLKIGCLIVPPALIASLALAIRV